MRTELRRTSRTSGRPKHRSHARLAPSLAAHAPSCRIAPRVGHSTTPVGGTVPIGSHGLNRCDPLTLIGWLVPAAAADSEGGSRLDPVPDSRSRSWQRRVRRRPADAARRERTAIHGFRDSGLHRRPSRA
ncbi:MAG: hypothetical protein QOH57_1616 [Mycobacterium sp.]|jgi:hypothetical protein|nr:hypothetical protein [Mycobacterium sp.]